MDKNFEKIASKGDITRSRPLCIRFHGFDVVIFQAGDRFYAVENLCPHQLISSLHKGTVEGKILTCPMHGWSFDMQTGYAAAGSGRLRTFDLDVREKDVWMERPEAQNQYTLF